VDRLFFPSAARNMKFFQMAINERPVPPGGNMIKWNWFGTWGALPDRASGHRIV
jgi:hypothetical protein